MLSTWKGFRGDNHRHIKKFSDLEEARANPPIECWNSSSKPLQNVLNRSLETRYARPFWVDNRATQKVLVEAPSPSPKRLVVALCLHMSKRCTRERLGN
uniref:CACTA en-spm transposon protein n=1 Tax=Cucumis melo TaxID=3656 RepID=A0A9I9E743_CUCME